MPAKKRRTWPGRVYLGRDEDGRQQFWWVGRFATRRERDDAIAWARGSSALGKGDPADGATCDESADRFLERMESGALKTKGGRRFKDSSIDTARASGSRLPSGVRPPRAAVDHARGGRGWGREGVARRSCRSWSR